MKKYGPPSRANAGHARKPAVRARRVGDLALQHLVVVLLHHVLRPLLQIGVGQVRDAIGRLHAAAVGLAVADMRMLGIVGDGRRRARHRDEVHAVRPLPRGPVRGEVGHRLPGLRHSTRDEHRGSRRSRDARQQSESGHRSLLRYPRSTPLDGQYHPIRARRKGRSDEFQHRSGRFCRRFLRHVVADHRDQPPLIAPGEEPLLAPLPAPEH